jgi:two-component system, NtrC family, sensor histidine kinase HydH
MRLTPFYAVRDNGGMGLRFKLRVQDILLTLMFGVLIFLAHDISERSFILGLAVLQLVEGRIPFLATLWGRTGSVVLQLTIAWVFIGYTHGVESQYWLMLMLPVLSAASYLGMAGTLATSIAAVGLYLSFLRFVDFREFFISPEEKHILAIRCLMLAVAAVLVNTLAAANRAANQSLLAAEAALRRSERLAALGQLSAGLAHELRNPLGSIKGSADLLARSASHNDPMAKELAEIISVEVDRTNSLVTRFLDFARPLEPRREPTDVTTVIDRAVARSKVEVMRDYDTSLPRLAIDPELMEQVFLNLVTNASQASAPGAPITIRTREVDNQAEVSVTDHGCGIPADKIETIFNPFVTTKQHGVGLGLAIVAKIVDGHGGKMAVESEPGKGSTFRVLLPIPSSS